MASEFPEDPTGGDAPVTAEQVMLAINNMKVVASKFTPAHVQWINRDVKNHLIETDVLREIQQQEQHTRTVIKRALARLDKPQSADANQQQLDSVRTQLTSYLAALEKFSQARTKAVNFEKRFNPETTIDRSKKLAKIGVPAGIAFIIAAILFGPWFIAPAVFFGVLGVGALAVRYGIQFANKHFVGQMNNTQTALDAVSATCMATEHSSNINKFFGTTIALPETPTATGPDAAVNNAKLRQKITNQADKPNITTQYNTAPTQQNKDDDTPPSSTPQPPAL